MSIMFYNEHTLGNLLAYYADCRLLAGVDRLTFIDDMAPRFHEYSRANATHYHESYHRRSKPTPIPATAIRAAALAPCKVSEAHDHVEMMWYNALEPSPEIARLIVELYHHVFWQQWLFGEFDPPLPRYNPVSITPCLYTAADLALMGSWPVFVNVIHANPDPFVKQYAGYLETLSQANTAVFHTEGFEASVIAPLMGYPCEQDPTRYFYLISRLFPSLPDDASRDVWDTARRLYREATLYNERRYPLQTRRHA